MKNTEILMVLSVAILIWWAISFSVEEAEQWQEFKVKHDCHLVSTTPTRSIMLSGQVAYISGEEGWLCNDGVTYYRSK